jgi:hypothetical protein
MNHRRRVGSAVAVILACVVSADLGWPGHAALARLSDLETVPATFSTETLDPPTGLGATATAGLVVTLSWTATVDLRATGYQVFRSTTNGGPYTQVGTVPSRTTTTFIDIPVVPGTYYYVLKTYFGTWTSVNGNQASVVAL